MWKCKKCGEENEEAYSICWNCGLDQNNPIVKDTQRFQDLKKESARTGTIRAYTSSYGTTRMLARLVSFIGWIIVTISIIVIILAFIERFKFGGVFTLIGPASSLAGVLIGLVLAMNGQLTRAAVDIADNTGEILFMMKKKIGK